MCFLSGDDPREFSAGYVAVALFVIPGFPLFSALVDLARFDITAGITRLVYALSVIVTASITVSMVSFISGLNPVVVEAGAPTTQWYFQAALASFIGLVAALVANRARLPRITISVPASVIMIPGTAMYRAMYHLNTGEIDQAMANAVSAGLIVVYICAGLAIARMLTDRDWAFGRFIDFPKKPGSPSGCRSPDRDRRHRTVDDVAPLTDR